MAFFTALAPFPGLSPGALWPSVDSETANRVRAPVPPLSNPVASGRRSSYSGGCCEDYTGWCLESTSGDIQKAPSEFTCIVPSTRLHKTVQEHKSGTSKCFL